MNSSAIAAALAAALFATVTITGRTATAAPDDDTLTEIVGIRGLDLTDRSNQDILRHRLAIAARHVCREPDIRDLEEARSYDECRVGALADASAQLRAAIAMADSRRRYADRLP